MNTKIASLCALALSAVLAFLPSCSDDEPDTGIDNTVEEEWQIGGWFYCGNIVDYSSGESRGAECFLHIVNDSTITAHIIENGERYFEAPLEISQDWGVDSEGKRNGSMGVLDFKYDNGSNYSFLHGDWFTWFTASQDTIKFYYSDSAFYNFYTRTDEATYKQKVSGLTHYYREHSSHDVWWWCKNPVYFENGQYTDSQLLFWRSSEGDDKVYFVSNDGVLSMKVLQEEYARNSSFNWYLALFLEDFSVQDLACSGAEYGLMRCPTSDSYGEPADTLFCVDESFAQSLLKGKTIKAYERVVEERPSQTPDGSVTGSVAEAVDMGLSVKWASWNLGADSEGKEGKFFRWGEVNPINTSSYVPYYWEEDSKYAKYQPQEDGDTKYCAVGKYSNASFFIGDGKTRLEAADDAATAIWGGNWRTPTKEEWEELCDENNCTWEENYNYGSGILVTSKLTGNHIWLKTTGQYEYRWYASGWSRLGSDHGRYMSSDIASWYTAYILNYYGTERQMVSDGLASAQRYDAYQIRPVCD